jgi:hypothetical protein
VVTFPRSRDLSFSVVNLGMTDTLLNLELYYDAGVFKSSSTQSVPPGTQFPRYFADLLGPEATSAQRWVRSFITSPDTYGLWLANNGSDLTYLDGLRTPSIRDALFQFILPVVQVGGGHNTQWLLVNPNLDQAHLTLRLIGSDGAQRGSTTRLLNGRGRAALDAPVVFPGVSEADYLSVESDRPIMGCELFGDAQKLAVMEPMVAGVDQGILYSPHVASGDFGGIVYETILTVINTSGQNATLLLTLYNDAGGEIGYYPFFSGPPETGRQPATVGLRPDPPASKSIPGRHGHHRHCHSARRGGAAESCPLQTPSQPVHPGPPPTAPWATSASTGIAAVNPENDTKIVNLKPRPVQCFGRQNPSCRPAPGGSPAEPVMPGLTPFGGHRSWTTRRLPPAHWSSAVRRLGFQFLAPCRLSH